jgi:hypothetical protein
MRRMIEAQLAVLVVLAVLVLVLVVLAIRQAGALNRAGDAWHVLLLCATTLGLVFTATGVVLGWRRLRKSRY